VGLCRVNRWAIFLFATCVAHPPAATSTRWYNYLSEKLPSCQVACVMRFYPTEGMAMASNIAYAPDIPTTLQSVTNELRRLQDLLMLAEDLDPRILTDFRDAVNRVRHTAWAVHEYGELIADEKEANPIASILAGERVRTVCQLCKLLVADLANPEIHLQDGQLLGLYNTTQELGYHLHELIGN